MVMSLFGLMKGADKTVPTPQEDWGEAKVDVIIPALNEEKRIVRCLASVMRQTLKPRRIVIVDDGSRDQTLERAKAFCAFHDIELVPIQRASPIGKTPTIKRQAHELDSDVEFILDADTILESDNYIERTVQELYQAVGIASACGTILPLREKDRDRADEDPAVQRFLEEHPEHASNDIESRWYRIATGITNVYREVLYLFLQRLVYRGQVVSFGTTSNPVGCAVAYRRKYVKNLFDYVTPLLGDDLTNSEDIFIGLAMLNEGYRNVQLTDVTGRTVEPPVHLLPRQVYLWSSSFLQSSYYFDALVRSPLKMFKRREQRQRPPRHRVQPALSYAGAAGPNTSVPGSVPTLRPVRSVAMEVGPATGATGSHTSGAVGSRGDRRHIREPYRQGFGRKLTDEYGRPAGWILMLGAMEKVFFPTVLLMMVLMRHWEAFWVTIAAETAVCLIALVAVTKGHRIQYFFKGLAVTPLRYALIASELVTLTRFTSDLWLTNNRRWRK
jgi:glycosyltransferase involved in cell wall biosynthesis